VQLSSQVLVKSALIDYVCISSNVGGTISVCKCCVLFELIFRSYLLLLVLVLQIPIFIMFLLIPLFTFRGWQSISPVSCTKNYPWSRCTFHCRTSYAENNILMCWIMLTRQSAI